MSEKMFCYCCRVHHPKDQMRRYRTGQGYRWRCERSITAATTPPRERDHFGRQQSELNRELSRLTAMRMNWTRQLERLDARSG